MPSSKSTPYKLSHVPCDIAMVIDVSGSMSADAPIPGETDELTGFSVLDLVKHACRTIISTLDERDRLAIVTFSRSARVLCPLTAMTPVNKKEAEAKVDSMMIETCTNLWQGLKDGIKLFENEENNGRVPAVLVLTDGMPNYMCPGPGYVPALRAMGNIVPSIHTFGFGYQLRSGLLKSIAELGRGSYSFIPDAGMIGTVFVHAVANLQSTFAINAKISLEYPTHILLEPTAGPSVGQQTTAHLHSPSSYMLTISLGSLHYGQSRDIYLCWDRLPQRDSPGGVPNLSATLQYNKMTASQDTTTDSCSLSNHTTSLSEAEIAYHISRHQLCAFIASLFPIDVLGEHRADKSPITAKQAQLDDLIVNIPASRFPEDPRCASLMQDLNGDEPLGQISLALWPEHFKRWGQHYLPSLHDAHSQQLCNSFKDPGPLQYGTDSPLFMKCRDRLNQMFDNLPVPTPSNLPTLGPNSMHSMPWGYGGPPVGPDAGAPPPYFDGGDLLRSTATRYSSDGRSYAQCLSMSRYNMPGNTCFAGKTRVLLANGKTVRLSSLRQGMSVATPTGARRVAAMVVTPVNKAVMIKMKGVLVTPWHPVALQDSLRADMQSREWVFPCCQATPQQMVRYTGRIYSVLLQRDVDVDAHAILLSGGREQTPLWGVTLGHGMFTGSDVRAHGFFGDYDRVVGSLHTLRARKGGRYVAAGVRRCPKTGLACGFRQF
ncbi:hypothetical protein M406DRAFT_342654 [Cryphonectria parasitica EP155]|uniref:VWFA domain-containing protein n=1 Tax=Cryphonectria parasitica (strain ATCC 38755 / EP155) TaxID=660469 RepID=A0A9P4XVY1_CRYP1|nr:uncharacterized protein M406DRAFT_342654 [Cryphonectria parasitica EP155]KAF3761998.1 hypothetical protein M406DRAFT_342654 [Cryphonectria parasitica EP155]